MLLPNIQRKEIEQVFSTTDSAAAVEYPDGLLGVSRTVMMARYKYASVILQQYLNSPVQAVPRGATHRIVDGKDAIPPVVTTGREEARHFGGLQRQLALRRPIRPGCVGMRAASFPVLKTHIEGARCLQPIIVVSSTKVGLSRDAWQAEMNETVEGRARVL